MEIKNVPIRDVKPYEKNPRKNAKAVPEVVKSLQEFGWRQPLVVDTNMVLIVGHTRLLAAKQLKMTEVPVHIADLSPAKAKAYRIMDNRTSDHSEWEYGTLLSELDELFKENNNYNLDFFNFDTKDFDKEVGFEADLPEDSEDKEKKNILTVTCENIEQLEDLFSELNDRGYKVKI